MNSDRMSTTELSAKTREVVSALYAAVVAEDLQAIQELIHPDIVVHEPDSLPNAGVHRGVDGLLTAIAPVFEMFDLSALEVEAIIVDGAWGVGLVRVPLRAGGVMPAAEVYRVEDGRILELRPYYWDTAALVAKADE